jgi:hypothetical protein
MIESNLIKLKAAKNNCNQIATKIDKICKGLGIRPTEELPETKFFSVNDILNGLKNDFELMRVEKILRVVIDDYLHDRFQYQTYPAFVIELFAYENITLFFKSEWETSILTKIKVLFKLGRLNDYDSFKRTYNDFYISSEEYPEEKYVKTRKSYKK